MALSSTLWLLSLAATSAFQPSPSSRHAVHRSTRLHSAAQQKEEEVATIQILMSDTGGGHRASANALRDAFNVLHETEPHRFPMRIECDIVDIYTDYGPFWPINAYVPLYKFMAEYSFLWKWFYEFGATELGLWMNDFLLELFCFEAFERCLRRDPLANSRAGDGVEDGANAVRADMVVSVHPLCQDLPLKILTSLDTDGRSRTEGRVTPFATVVTDLGGAHPTWFNKGVDKCFVPSTVLKNAALQRQVQESQIVQYGLPIRRGFWRFGADYNQSSSSSSNDDAEQKPKPFWQFGKKTKKQPADDIQMEEKGMHHKPTIRDSLGLLDLPTVLIVGGGDGMGGIVNQATAVGERLQSLAAKRNDSSSNNNDPMYQMVVICGNNKSAQTALSPPQTNWGSNVAVNVKGFVNNMDEFMRASDILVTKAGPGTIAEASICGLPCILSSFLPGQEEGNVPYVEENGFGCYKGTPEGIADTVEEWLSVSSVTTEGTILETMRECALNAARPDATLDIARDLADMVYTRKEELKRKGVEKKVNEVAVAA